MIWRLLEGRDVMPKFLVSGCPKHGLHLAAMLVEGCVERQPADIYRQNHWSGTYRFNSFTHEFQPMERWFFLMSRLQQGTYVQGHIGWRQDIADFLRLSRVAHVFIYRDLRDVAVSQTHHVLSDDAKQHRHPARGAYRAMGGFDQALTAVIEGMGPFPGVIELWEAYAPWLEERWVHTLKFEDVLADLQNAAESILQYGLDQITRDIWDVRFAVERSIFDDVVTSMVNLASVKEASPTFRKGQPGEWREVFTEQHKDLFKAHDQYGWLERLGYEDSEDW